jgi:ATP adenylyltransferase
MNYTLTGDLNAAPSRFSWITAGCTRGPLPVFDEPLAADSEAVAVPSLGSIVPGWTLLVPRQRVLTFGSMSTSGREKFSALRQLIRRQLRATFDGTIYEFEHGPSQKGGKLGCGVDQAHLHIVPLCFDLIQMVRLIPGHAIEVPPHVEDGWTLIPRSADYLFVRNADTSAGIILLPDVPQSQALRRVVAEQVGCAKTWNYRQVFGLSNATRTQDAFTKASTYE